MSDARKTSSAHSWSNIADAPLRISVKVSYGRSCPLTSSTCPCRSPTISSTTGRYSHSRLWSSRPTLFTLTLSMDNKAIANILYETADLLEIDGQDSFRIRSYRNAAQAIENHSQSDQGI